MRFDVSNIEPFPPLEAANPEGLLAIGGDLSPARLVLAYRSGIFPWYNETDPILWWSPDPRCVILPNEFAPSRSLRKSIRNRGYVFTVDTAFPQVIEACAGFRKQQPGTWLSKPMREAYCRLAESGIAHSAEVWHDGRLVGGLYGIAIGSVFFGESMFSHMTDASKVAYALLNARLLDWDFSLVDCQVSSPHIISLGAREIPRDDFMERLEWALANAHEDQPGGLISSNWNNETNRGDV